MVEGGKEDAEMCMKEEGKEEGMGGGGGAMKG